MATTQQKEFKAIRLFKATREMNVSADTIRAFLEEHGYEAALSGAGLNAKITSPDAYAALLEAYADDAAAAERVRELRTHAGESPAPGRDEAATLPSEEAPEEVEEDVEAPEEAVAEEASAEETSAEEASAEEASAEETPVEPAEEAPVEKAAAEEVEETATSEEGEEAPTPEQIAHVEAAEEETADAEAVSVGETEDEAVAEASEGEAPVPETPEAEEEETAEADVVEIEEDEEAPVEEDEEALDEADEGTAEDELPGDGEEEGAEGTLRADRYRLKGPSVVGQVDVAKFKKRRRRRKRKKKTADKKSASKKKRSKRRKKKGRKPDEQDVEERLQETLRDLKQGASRTRQRRRQRRRERHAREREEARQRQMQEERILRVTEFVSTGELANLMDESVNDVIQTLFGAGMMVSINQRLDADAIHFVADEYGYEVEFTTEQEGVEIDIEEDRPEDLVPRAPVVTVMGHVDHGKTSLLDYIRHENVVAGEAGGITQHIGAHYVELPDGRAISFLDTPGHEAFTAMRARGAQATDLVILVVAADDAVMPQTKEAINHAQAADVPIVVAINKIDLPDADSQKVMAQLAEENVLVEPYGGKVQCALVSAKTGEGVDDLLDKVLLEAELHELRANPSREAVGTIIESRLEKGRGNVITVLVENGTLEVGDPFVAGIYSGRVRAMFDERDQRIDTVSPSKPALILGSGGAAEVGDQFVVLDEESEARDIAQARQQIHREQQLRQQKHITLDEIGRRLALGEFHELNLVIKGDVGGSVEALSDALLKLATEEVAVNIVHSGVGAITETDVMLASASDAVILGFQVRPTVGARHAAEQEEIDVRSYSVIYEAVEDVHDALEGMLSPEEKEETLGTAEVRQIFRVPKVGTVAGCRVMDGRIHRNDKVRVIRDGVVVYEGTLSSLKHHQDDVREIQSGYECGLSVENFNDVKEGDELEAYRVVEIARTLEV